MKGYVSIGRHKPDHFLEKSEVEQYYKSKEIGLPERVGKGLPLVRPLEYIDVGHGQLVLGAEINCLDDDDIKE